MKTNKTKVAVVGTALSGAAVAALLSTAGPALAYTSGGLHVDAKAQSPARLIAGGAALKVPVDTDCNATPYAYLTVNVTEQVNGRIATGGGFTNLGCTGGHQVVLIPVTASSGKAFAPGRAVATAQISGCSNDNMTCGNESRTNTIALRR